MSLLLDPLAPAPATPAVEEEARSPELAGRARWERPALAVLLLGTGVLYLWGLSASGWANSFYSAAAQAGSHSWKAFFFGASDAAGSITVDKPPLSLWPMGLSVRIFGLSSWSILAPQALMGVAAVGVVYATVRRRASAAAALLAGAVLALTPVATLMFRFNNPDAMLTLLMALAACTAIRAVEDDRTRWLVLTGALVGLGFLAKQLQVLLIVPGLALAYAIAGPDRIVRRLRGLLIAGASIVAAAGWWIAIVQLVPKSWRPYVGGSQHNSILELTFGYNGFGRLTGNETGSVTGGGPAGGGRGMWGQTGITRLFDGVSGGQITWLLPAALALGVAGLWITRRAPRRDPMRAAILVFGGWLVVTALVFSYMGGIYHDYYTVALAPPIAGLIGLGGHLVWQHRSHVAATTVLAAVTAVTALWASKLVGRSDWTPWLSSTVLVFGLIAATFLAASHWLGRRVIAATVGAAVVVGLAGPTAWSLETAGTAHEGAIVTAGPSVTTGFFRPGGFGGFPRGNAPAFGGQGGPPLGGPNALPGGGTFPAAGGPFAGGFGGFGRAGGMGGLLGTSRPSDAVVAALLRDADDYTWVAATVGADNAAGYQLATERSVMPIGGFNGTDPSPTLEQFQRWVADGKIHWFIGGGLNGRGANGGSQTSQEIVRWVEANFTATSVGNVTMYDLTPRTAA